MVRVSVTDPNHSEVTQIIDEAQLDRIFDELKDWNDILQDTSVSDTLPKKIYPSSKLEGGRHGE
jgi:hypothetical protein